MASLIRRESDFPNLLQAFEPLRSIRGYEPMRLLRELMRFDPFREMEPMAEPGPAFLTPVDGKETAEAFELKLDVPGIKDEDLDISLTGNRLTISGKRDVEEKKEGDAYFVYERSYGTFSRSFTLPDNADLDGVSAELKNGVLAVSIKKRAPSEVHKIPVGGKAKEKKVEEVKVKPAATESGQQAQH